MNRSSDWLHIFLFNVFQLLIFRRCDVVSMYSLRFVYYFIWHVVWGHIRVSARF